MTDISGFTKDRSMTVDAIYSAYKADGDAEKQRGYLGASIIGAECERYLWFAFRQACREDISGRVYRLFETGDREEGRMVANLRRIGCTVHDFDPATGEQFEVMDLGGHLSGHMDACLLGLPEAPKTWHVCEFKTHKEKSFRDLVKKGVQKSKPQHYGQMQMYMHKTGMKRALYLAVNKDTDELQAERINYDAEYCKGLDEKAVRVISRNEAASKISEKPDYYKCKWCPAQDVCHGAADEIVLPIPSVSCRQCCFATARMDHNGAAWHCSKQNRFISLDEQDRGCESHLILPELVSAHSTPQESGIDDNGEHFIIFRLNEPGSEGWIDWRHGSGGWSTEELRVVSISALSNPVVTHAKELFGGSCQPSSKGTVVARYTDETSCLVWNGHRQWLQEAWTERYGTTFAGLAVTDEEYHGDLIACEYDTCKGQVAVTVNMETHHAEIREGKQ